MTRLSQRMTPETVALAYLRLFPRRLRQAHQALITWAEEANPDGWPTPSDVCRFSKLYGVPRGDLGGLVGMLSMRPPGTRKEAWLDAVRQPASATRYSISRHSVRVQRAFGWFLYTADLGWFQRSAHTIH